MDYRLAKNNGDAVAVPTLVLHRLDTADGDQLRVALAILRDGEVREEALLREFPQHAPALFELVQKTEQTISEKHTP